MRLCIPFPVLHIPVVALVLLVLFLLLLFLPPFLLLLRAGGPAACPLPPLCALQTPCNTHHQKAMTDLEWMNIQQSRFMLRKGEGMCAASRKQLGSR